MNPVSKNPFSFSSSKKQALQARVPRATTRAWTSQDAFTLMETLVYMSVFVVLIGVSYIAMNRFMDASNALRRNVDDISKAVNAGEYWRADIRAAGSAIRLEDSPDAQVLRLPGARGEISWRFAANGVSRRIGENAWLPMLGNVKASAFISEPRSGVPSWRWELELQNRSRKVTGVRPLFTFIAVPAIDAAK